MKKFFSVLVLVGLAVSGVAVGQVEPPLVEEELAVGGAMEVEKVVTTPEIPPDPEICFLADTTGSMGPAIVNVQANAVAVMNSIQGSQPTAEFCVGQYKDFGDVFVFNLDQAMTGNTTTVQTAINSWSASGGGDTPEAQLTALHELATNPAVGYDGPNRIIVWFGDASGHDPSGVNTQASVIADLTTAPGIKVIAIPVNSGFGDGLDATGQATAITGATGGVLLPDATPEQLSQAILDGLAQLTTDVWWEIDPATCDAGLNVTLDPAVHLGVPGGTPVNFTETIAVDNDPALEGTTLQCVVTFIANHYPEEGAPIGRELIRITVPDTTPPTAQCVETVNPHGQTVPKAPAKGGQGQNQDGYYELLARDLLDPNPAVWLKDTGSGTLFGPFASGIKVKYVEANGATPSQTPMGGNNGNGNGQATSVDWQIKGTGDAAVYAVDAAGNTSAEESCLVPPPPK
ncbi:MAG: VWA domain-containing protein [Candidatus Wildermuthbacteria bacterium]|nr:VWA domain-containing protein [Candidatus Wildermuthbacteria bacterium]